MKRMWLILVVSFCLLYASQAIAEEITLYNSEGAATAYIDTDNDLTVYLWNGKPVAYLEEDSIYGFNGKHLGWFEEGIIWDHKGFAVGCIKDAVSMLYKLEPLKSLKQLKPLRSLKELKPLKPLKNNKWSSYPISLFLAGGR